MNTETKPAASLSCHVCNKMKLRDMRYYERFHRVTSDCKPWPPGGKLSVCGECGCVQKVIDPTWEREIDEIYRNYSIYHQGGVEQPVFDAASGQSSSRSSLLIDKLSGPWISADQGRLLDIGCGNGALLKAFSKKFGEWRMVGTELNEKYRSQVEAIPGVESMMTCDPAKIEGTFDVITMVHVLEHVPAPIGFLRNLKTKLSKGAILVIEVPNFLRNPFDLLIADHSTHFTSESLSFVVRAAGFNVRMVTTEWIAKELTLVATPAEVGEAVIRRGKPEDPRMLNWFFRGSPRWFRSPAVFTRAALWHFRNIHCGNLAS